MAFMFSMMSNQLSSRQRTCSEILRPHMPAWKLGATDIRKLRAEAFGRVFDHPDVSDILKRLSLKGDRLEVTLDDPGALELVMS
jgi:hypothetical protein